MTMKYGLPTVIVLMCIIAGCAKKTSYDFSSPEYQSSKSIKVPVNLYKPVYKEAYPISGEYKNVVVTGKVSQPKSVKTMQHSYQETQKTAQPPEGLQQLQRLKDQSVAIEDSLYRVWHMLRLSLNKHSNIQIIEEKPDWGQIKVQVGDRQYRYDVWEQNGQSRMIVLTGEGTPIQSQEITKQLMDIGTRYIKKQTQSS